MSEEKKYYYQEKYEDESRERKTLERQLDEIKFSRNWLIAIILILCFIIFIGIVGLVESGETIINGYSLEQVTNATIQTCKALS